MHIIQGLLLTFFFQLATRATGEQTLLARTEKRLARIYKQCKLIYIRRAIIQYLRRNLPYSIKEINSLL